MHKGASLLRCMVLRRTPAIAKLEVWVVENAELARVRARRLLQVKLPEDELTQIVVEAVEIEREFVTDALPVQTFWRP